MRARRLAVFLFALAFPFSASGRALDAGAFSVQPLPEGVIAHMKKNSCRPQSCRPLLKDLRYVRVLHKTLDGKTRKGELVLNRHIARQAADIFKKLYEAGYPIERIRLADDYGADDERSMRDNNTSAFNYRPVSGTKRLSKHSLGLAVDINTRFNPYVRMRSGKMTVEPANGAPYADRSKSFPYKIEAGDLCLRLFKEAGFVWGGSWKSVKDYQHFEVPDTLVKAWYPDY